MGDNAETARHLCNDFEKWGYASRVAALTAALDAVEKLGYLRAEEVHKDTTPDDSEILYFAVWAQLSTLCQDDLMHCRPGAIIRCTERDFGLLAPIPLSSRTLKSLQDRIMAARENQNRDA